MDFSDAADYAQMLDTSDRIAGDSSRSFYGKAKAIGPIAMGLQGAYPTRSQSSGGNTFGAVLGTAIGSALGYGLGRGIGASFGLSPDRTDALAMAGASYGGLVGLSKSAQSEESRRDAFRVGFLKAAIDRGYFKKQAFIGSLLLSPLTGLSGVAQQAGASAGAVLGSADAPDDIDTSIVREKVETELLRQELKRVEAVKRNQLLKQLLAKRKSAIK